MRKRVILLSNASFKIRSLYGDVIPVKAKSYGSLVNSCAKSLSVSGSVFLKLVRALPCRSNISVPIKLSNIDLLHPFSTVCLTKKTVFSILCRHLSINNLWCPQGTLNISFFNCSPTWGVIKDCICSPVWGVNVSIGLYKR